jgi:hypothetical protein
MVTRIVMKKRPSILVIYTSLKLFCNSPNKSSKQSTSHLLDMTPLLWEDRGNEEEM